MITTAVLVATIRSLTPAQLFDAAPGLRADTVHDLRDQFADWAARQRPAEEVDTWQEAWNRWARVDQSRRLGSVQVNPRRCPGCRGRRFSSRTLRACMTCYGGSRRAPAVTVSARWLQPPTDTRQS